MMKQAANPPEKAGTSDHEIQAQKAFQTLYAAWARDVIDYIDPGSSEERIAEIERGGDHEMELARQLLATPAPAAYLITHKIDILMQVMSSVESNMSPCDHLIMVGLGALRADIINHLG